MILKTRYTIDEKSLYLYYTFVNSKGDDYICFCALASIVFDEQRQRKLTPATKPPMGLLSNQRESIEKPKSLFTSTRSNAHGFFRSSLIEILSKVMC